MSKTLLPMFSSKSFVVSNLTFRSLIHFELSFVYGVRKYFNFILSHVVAQFSHHHLLKRLSFLHCYSCLLCHSWGNHRCIYLWTVYPVPLTCVSVFVPIPYCFDYYEVRQPNYFLKTALAIYGFLCFHTNCKILCSNSVKNATDNLICIALNL